jgi:ABC-type phosphate/phosphonate transport system substrate-binding protein
MKTKNLIVCAMIAFMAVAFSSINASAQKKVDVKSTVAVKTRGANPNIKMDAPTTDAKPVAKARGAACTVKFDNYTGLYIKVYVDGYYKGTLDAWGSGTVTVAGGYTKIYCVSAGGTREWNASGDCQGGYTYSLR